MRASLRIRNSLKQHIQISNETDRIISSFNSKMQQQIIESHQSLTQFQTSFQMQINLIQQTQIYSKKRLENIINSNHQHLFWNELKETIMQRQIKENQGLRKIADHMDQYENKGIQYEERVHQELMKEVEEADERKAGKFKNLTNNRESKFNASLKTIEIIVENGRDKSRFQLKYIQQSCKYVPIQQYHPKAIQLISQYNFHRDLSRLQQQLTYLVLSLP